MKKQKSAAKIIPSVKRDDEIFAMMSYASEDLDIDWMFDDQFNIDPDDKGYNEYELLLAILLFLLGAQVDLFKGAKKIYMNDIVKGGIFPKTMTLHSYCEIFDDETIAHAVVTTNDSITSYILNSIDADSYTLVLSAILQKKRAQKPYFISAVLLEPKMILDNDFVFSDRDLQEELFYMLEGTIALFPEHIDPHFCGCSECCEDKFFSYCEDYQMTYTISCAMDERLIGQFEKMSDQAWIPSDDMISTAEIVIRKDNWNNAHRVVAARSKTGEDLFGPVFQYSAVVTNIKDRPPHTILEMHDRMNEVDDILADIIDF